MLPSLALASGLYLGLISIFVGVERAAVRRTRALVDDGRPLNRRD